jgi:hypothetical protein
LVLDIVKRPLILRQHKVNETVRALVAAGCLFVDEEG